MQPRNRKHKKEFRGRMRGIAWRGSEVTFGEYGLQATDRGWITAKQIEAARKTVARATKRRGRIWIKMFPHKPVTKKSDEVTRGAGKGEVSHYVAVIKPGLVLLEIGGLEKDVCVASLKLAAQKLPIKTRVIEK